MRQRLAVVVDLRVLLGRRVGDAVGAGEEPVEMVEAAILRVDDDDVLDLVETGCAVRAEAAIAQRREQATREQQRRNGDAKRFSSWQCPTVDQLSQA